MTLLSYWCFVISIYVVFVAKSMDEDDFEDLPRTPYLRSATARTLYSKMLIDERLRRMDWRQEYELQGPVPPAVGELYVPLDQDAASAAFVTHCYSQGLASTLLTEVLRGVLGVLLPQTTVNGLLNRGRMFVWSKEQAAVLLGDNNALREDNNVLREDNNVLGEQCSPVDVAGRTSVGEQLGRTVSEHCSPYENTWSCDLAPVHGEQKARARENTVLQGKQDVLDEQHGREKGDLQGEQEREQSISQGEQKGKQCAYLGEQGEQEGKQCAVLGEQGEQEGKQCAVLGEQGEQEGKQDVPGREQEREQGEQEGEQFYDASDTAFLLSGEQKNTAHTVLHVQGEQREKQWPWSGARLLDVGAGDGHVTAVLGTDAGSVTVTEISAVMRARLRSRGYRVLDAHGWPDNDGSTYDIVTCLNVLDRHHSPRRLLGDIGGRLGEGGRLVLAVVLPFTPFIEYDVPDHAPLEVLGVQGYTFEEQVSSLVTVVLPGLGYRVEKWSKVPYMCEGDLEQSIYWLQDAIFVCSKL